jgi:type I restriction enzyme R subunit
VNSAFTESVVEEAALDWLRALGYTILHGPDLAPGEPGAERETYGDALLEGRLRAAIARLNPKVPPAVLDDSFARLTAIELPSLVERNRSRHRMLIDGVSAERLDEDGRIVGEPVRVIDFDDPDHNDWVALNQFTVIEAGRNRRPDIVLFVNGLPFAVIELKDATDEQATIWSAHNQLQTYKAEIPSLFDFNEILVISDGVEARVGSLTANREWFLPWGTIEGEDPASNLQPELETVLTGLFDRRRVLVYLRHFITFEDDRGKLRKILAGYHQFHAVNRAIAATLEAASRTGDRRGGVVWHTQGSGKSLTMAFFAGRAVLHPDLANPTILVLTDRNDLDEQLFGQFARCHELVRQTPRQAESAAELRTLLAVPSGGVIFTTVQKFLPDVATRKMPMLTDRRNVIVIADEAHRSQYDFVDGFARHLRDALPGATFVGFTGTPIELADRSTKAIFGDYISVYDIQRAVADKAIVPIYYESRLAKLDLDADEKPRLDAEFQEVTEDEESAAKERLKTKWAALEAVVGTDKRLDLVAKDLVTHFEDRRAAIEGKGMVVCMSRRIAVALYAHIRALRPEWHNDDDSLGALKVVMTGSASDPLDWQMHIRNKPRREKMADRFKNPADPLKLVIVRDMWLTGFDAPSLHTMYLDKPMRGHGLMQAIARVNRVFADKPSGLVVDYLGLANELREALADYTQSGGKGKTVIDQAEAVAVLQEKHDIVGAIFHGFDSSAFHRPPATQRITVLKGALEHVLAQPDGKKRLLTEVSALSRAFALAVPHEEALRMRDDVAFYQSVRAALAKATPTDGAKSRDEMEHAIRQIVSGAILSEGVIDIFAAAGLPKPDISILSDAFLGDIRNLPQKNLAVELLERLLRDDIRVRMRKNLVQSRAFSDILERSLRAYQNRAVEAAQVIEHLIDLAKQVRAARSRGEVLHLTEDELAFYDALEVNDSAVAILGDEALRDIARELVKSVRANTTIDWTVKETVRAKLRVTVRRILRRHGYPPDKQEQATQTVLKQAELLSSDWALEPASTEPAMES